MSFWAGKDRGKMKMIFCFRSKPPCVDHTYTLFFNGFPGKIGQGFSIIPAHACANSTEPKVPALPFQNRKNMKASQTLFVRKISKGLPIVTNNPLPGSEPKVSVSILHDIARDITGTVGSGDGFAFHKRRIAIRSTHFRWPGRRCFRLACVVFGQICHALFLAGSD